MTSPQPTHSRNQTTTPMTVRSPRLGRSTGSRLALAGVLVGSLVAASAACRTTTAVSAAAGSTVATAPGTGLGTRPGTGLGTGPGSIVAVPGPTPTTAKPTITRAPGTPPPASYPTTTVFVASPPPVAATSDDGAIYLALIRTSIDRTTLDPKTTKKPYGGIVIVDHGVRSAGEATSMGSSGTDGPAFSAAVLADLRNGLSDLGPVSFAASPKAGSVASAPGDEHVLVIAGPIERVGTDGTTVHVGLSKTCGPMCGSGGTDILERRDGQWVVTGSTGSSWIS